METNSERLYDVVVLDKNRVVKEIIASRTHLDAGYYSAKRWKNTWLSRVLPPNRVAIVNHSCGIGEEILFSEEASW